MSETPKHETFHPDKRVKSVCRSCQAKIFWLTMLSGSNAPVDFEPNTEKGNIRVLETGRGQVLKDEELVEARQANEPLYLSHFATCSNSAFHRKKRA